MKDFLGTEINVGDVIVYGNDAGFITLALVTEIKEDKLRVIKRGYRDSVVDKFLIYPDNVLVVTDSVAEADLEAASNPLELKFIFRALEKLNSYNVHS